MEKKKLWIIIGSVAGAVAVAVVVLVLALSGTFGEIFKSAKETRHVEIIINNTSYGSVSRTSISGDYEYGSSPKFVIMPKDGKCISSIKVNDVEVFDYLNNAEIDIAKNFEYTIEKLDRDSIIKVEFDEQQKITELVNYINTKNLVVFDKDGVRVDSGDVSDIANVSNFGEVSIWGKSNCFPKNGVLKLSIAPSRNFTFLEYKLPPIEYNGQKHNATEDFELKNVDGKPIVEYYSGESAMIIYDYNEFVDSATNTHKFELYFKPNDIVVEEYRYEGGEFVKVDTEDGEPLSLALYQKMAYSNGYNIYYSNSSVLDYAEMVATGKITPIPHNGVNGDDGYYFRLLPEMYADNDDARKIILVYVAVQ